MDEVRSNPPKTQALAAYAEALQRPPTPGQRKPAAREVAAYAIRSPLTPSWSRPFAAPG